MYRVTIKDKLLCKYIYNIYTQTCSNNNWQTEQTNVLRAACLMPHAPCCKTIKQIQNTEHRMGMRICNDFLIYNKQPSRISMSCLLLVLCISVEIATTNTAANTATMKWENLDKCNKMRITLMIASTRNRNIKYECDYK